GGNPCFFNSENSPNGTCHKNSPLFISTAFRFPHDDFIAG
ncbi:MAG: hypothetical protein ACI97P_000870, partial [Arcticibacterium sp.]